MFCNKIKYLTSGCFVRQLLFVFGFLLLGSEHTRGKMGEFNCYSLEQVDRKSRKSANVDEKCSNSKYILQTWRAPETKTSEMID